jgi:uncharacterized membrane protein YdjX (TVP38/TMEM64 family)
VLTKLSAWHIISILILVATVLITIKHDEVVAVCSVSSLLSDHSTNIDLQKLRPFSEKVRDLPAGWLIPIAILFVISFPPLFGHEIIALLCGVVYGLWIGFAIVAWLTNHKSVGTWFAFKHLFRRKAVELERKNLNYGALARLTRDGGFWIVLIIRLSAVPSHFSTAVFSTCDVRFWHFFVSTFLSLPKQIVLVYLGVLLVANNDDSAIKTVMFLVLGAITIILGVWIYIKMRTVKKVLLEEQEQRRVKKAESVQMVPTVRSAFERRYDDVEPTEWTMVPAQPARMV